MLLARSDSTSHSVMSSIRLSVRVRKLLEVTARLHGTIAFRVTAVCEFGAERLEAKLTEIEQRRLPFVARISPQDKWLPVLVSTRPITQTLETPWEMLSRLWRITYTTEEGLESVEAQGHVMCLTGDAPRWGTVQMSHGQKGFQPVLIVSFTCVRGFFASRLLGTA